MTTTTRPHLESIERPAATEPVVPAAPVQAPVLDVVISAHNRERDLVARVRSLHRELGRQLPATWRLTIVDEASGDATWPIACRLARELPEVRALRLAAPGRGHSWPAASARTDAAIAVWLDLDAGIDPAALHPLVAPLLSGHSDVSVGLAGPVRHRGHRLARRAPSDLIAVRLDRVRDLLPVKADRAGCETALLRRATRAGLRVFRLPVDRVDEPTAPTAGQRPAGRWPRTGAGRQALRFAMIGAASTLAYVGIYVALRPDLGAFGANTAALLVTAVANTAANRRLTFGIRDRAHAVKHQVQGLAVFGIALGVTTVSLAVLPAADAHAGRLVEAAVLVTANLTASVLRFVLMRRWVFRAVPTPG